MKTDNPLGMPAFTTIAMPPELRPRRRRAMTATHFLLPREIYRSLNVLCRRTRVTQADYVREALNNLLAKYSGNQSLDASPAEAEPAMVLRSVVVRIERAQNNKLNELAKQTRVRRSEHLREAISDLLERYSEILKAA
jgi:predicted DNA-binding protein